jgi:hypothetical protein
VLASEKVGLGPIRSGYVGLHPRLDPPPLPTLPDSSIPSATSSAPALACVGVDARNAAVVPSVMQRLSCTSFSMVSGDGAWNERT